MRVSLVAVGILVLVSAAVARQTGGEYVINPRVFAGNPLDSWAVQLVASPALVVAAGRQAILSLGDATDGLRLSVTPSDLGCREGWFESGR